MAKTNKLYVWTWTGVLTGHASGMMVATGRSLDEAREKLAEKYGKSWEFMDDLWKQNPEIFDIDSFDAAAAVWGCGCCN